MVRLTIYDIIPHGLVVRISGFHPGGPGSIPGAGMPSRHVEFGTKFERHKLAVKQIQQPYVPVIPYTATIRVHEECRESIYTRA